MAVYFESSREKLRGISGNLLIRFNEWLAIPEDDPNSTSGSRVVIGGERSIFMKVGDNSRFSIANVSRIRRHK